MPSLFQPQLFSVGLFGSSVFGNTATDGCIKYATREDIESIFGEDNLIKWADLDGDREEDDIEDRIGFYLCEASTIVDGRLHGGPYSIPFTSPFPRRVTAITARLAGCLIYEARGYLESDEDLVNPRKVMAQYHKEVIKWLSDVRARRVKILGLNSATDIPKVICA